MLVLIISGFLLSSCCSPKTCIVTVNFIGAHEELGLEDYKFGVDFDETKVVSIYIPEGFDHKELVCKIEDVVQEYTVEFDSTIEEEYQYSIGKTLSFEIRHIKRSFELKVDLTNMTKLKFDINLEKGMKGFKVVTVDKSHLKNFVELKESIISSEIHFVNNTASIEYGEYAFLVHETSKENKTVYQTLYSTINRFTNDANKNSIGSLAYSEYKISKKGNTKYLYNGSGTSSIIYVGEIKESIDLYSSIPDYVAPKGFEIDRLPNVFYLFTNLSEYNSDLSTIETYTSTKSIYDSNNSDMDKIGDLVIQKVSPSMKYNERYDVHQVYLGASLKNDTLLTEMQKVNISEDLYIKFKSNIAFENLHFILLEYEAQDIKGRVELFADQLSAKGDYYIHLTFEDMMKYSLVRDTVDSNNNVHEYYSGSAILYVELDYDHFQQDRTSGEYKYTRIWLIEDIITASDLTDDDFYFVVYIKDGEKKNYGLIDYHYLSYLSNPFDCVYFETKDLFEDDKDQTYKGNLYAEIRTKNYVDYRSVAIKHLYFTIDKTSLTPFEPAYVEDAKEFNGYKDFPVPLVARYSRMEFDLKVEIALTTPYSSVLNVNFTHMSLPEQLGNNVYLTNHEVFSDISNFNFVNYLTKDTFKLAKLGYSYDLYYFSNTNIDFDIYLDPNDKSTKVSSTKTLYDITGKPITVEVNGEPYTIKVIMLDRIYSTIDGCFYAIEKES